MNKNKLESVMKLFGDTGDSLSQYLGISRSSFSAKLNETNGREFNKREIALIKKKYCLTPWEVVNIFFS